MTKRLRGRGAPLQIDEVSAPGDRVIIGMSSCPGEKDDGLFGDLWDRDLEDDLRRIREWGGSALITLLEEDELKRLGVMRVAPVGLICAAHWGEIPHELALSRAFELGCRIAAITHGHPSGYLSAGAFAAIIFGIARGNTIAGAVGDARSVLAGWPGHDECLAALDRAVERAGAHDPDPETVSRIGEGWTAEEALAIGLYAALAAEGDFAEGVRIAVNHDGESDSTGSIAGSILGLHDGRDAIPLRWLETLELKGRGVETGELLAAP